MVCGFQNLNENKVLQLESTQKWLPRQIKHITIEQMINYPKLARLKERKKKVEINIRMYS